MKSKIEKKLKKKKNPKLVETIIKAKKNGPWLKVAHLISTPKRKTAKMNLFEINEQAQEGDIIVVPGKVLGTGRIDKKIKIAAISFSKTAIEKLNKSKSKATSIIEEIKLNPKAEGIKILKT